MEEKLYYVLVDCTDCKVKVSRKGDNGEKKDTYTKKEALEVASDMLEVGGCSVTITDTELAEFPECG